MVTQSCHIAFSFNALKPSGYLMDRQGLTFRRSTFYPQRAYLFLYGYKKIVVSSLHEINLLLFWARMGVFTGSCVLTRSPTRYGTHGTESYTSFLRRCFCTAFCCRPRTRVSSLMVQARYSIDTFSLTHKLWQRTHRRVATLLRTDTPCSPTAASTSCCHHMAEIDT
jgi:hypothetical protein